VEEKRMPALIGFDPVDTLAIQKVISDARLCLDSALREAFDDNDRFQTRLAKYFGTDESNIHAVMKVINSMKLVVDGGLYHVQRELTGHDTTGTGRTETGLAVHFKSEEIQFGGTAARRVRTARIQGTLFYEGKRVNVIEATEQWTADNGPLDMKFFDAYFDLPYKAFDAQSQVQVFLHELSHMAGGTVDVDAPAGYEWPGVQYCISIKKAAHNAENYGMFLASYLA